MYNMHLVFFGLETCCFCKASTAFFTSFAAFSAACDVFSGVPPNPMRSIEARIDVTNNSERLSLYLSNWS